MINEYINRAIIDKSGAYKVFYTKKDMAQYLAIVDIVTSNLQKFTTTTNEDAKTSKKTKKDEVKILESITELPKKEPKTIYLFNNALSQDEFIKYLKINNLDISYLDDITKFDNNHEYALLIFAHMFRFFLLGIKGSKIEFICERLEIKNINDSQYNSKFLLYRSMLEGISKWSLK